MARIIKLGLLEENHLFITKGFRVATMIKTTKKQNRNTSKRKVLFNKGGADGIEDFKETIHNRKKYQKTE